MNKVTRLAPDILVKVRRNPGIGPDKQQGRSMTTGRSAARRVLDLLFGLATWVAAGLVVLWFYSWMNRWYVVVGVVLALVVGGIVVERLAKSPAADAAPASDLLPLPLPLSLPRTPDPADPAASSMIV